MKGQNILTYLPHGEDSWFSQIQTKYPSTLLGGHLMAWLNYLIWQPNIEHLLWY